MSDIKILAHRGGLLNAPENTVKSFELAFENGADGIECDVRLSKDGQFVLVHDENLKRISGENKLISQLTLSELKKKKVFEKEPIADIYDLFEVLIKYPDKECYLEICFDNIEKLFILANEILKADLHNRIYLLFFSNSNFPKNFKIKKKDVKLSIMPVLPLKIVEKAEKFHADNICIGWVNLFMARELFMILSKIFRLKNQIQTADEKNIFVSGGVANRYEEVDFFLNLGVRAIWTDDVPFVRQYIIDH